MQVSFTVYGKPQVQGSIRAFMHKGANFPSLTTDNAKLKPWRQDLFVLAQLAMREAGLKLFPQEIPVQVSLLFVFSKPKSAKKARLFPTVKPDIDKLERACLDGLTGSCVEDDSQVVSVTKDKIYGSPERVEITVKEKI